MENLQLGLATSLPVQPKNDNTHIRLFEVISSFSEPVKIIQHTQNKISPEA